MPKRQKKASNGKHLQLYAKEIYFFSLNVLSKWCSNKYPANTQQSNNVDTTSLQRRDVAATL